MLNSAKRSDVRFLAAVLAVAALFFFAYSNHFQNGFHFDDGTTITNNAYVGSTANIPLFFRDAGTFSTAPYNQIYRPLLSSIFAIIISLWGYSPAAFQGVGFAAFTAVGILLFLVLLKILDIANPGSVRNRYWALFATGFFLLTPANTEAANYITQEAELFSLLGILLSFFLYLYSKKARTLYWYLVPMFVAALIKIDAVVFAPILLVFIFLFEARETRFASRVWESVKRSLPAIGAAAALSIFTIAMAAPTAFWTSISPLVYAMNQPFSIAFYAFSLFFPFNLSIDHGWQPVIGFFDPKIVLSIFFLIALAAVIVRTAKRRETKPIAFGLAWFLIALLPTSSFAPLAALADDYRTFPAYPGLVLAATWAVWLLYEQIGKKKNGLRFRAPAAVLCAAVFLSANTLGTWNRNKVWSSDELLWKDAVEKNPQDTRALMNYGVDLESSGDLALAKTYFERAAELAPGYMFARLNLAVVESRLGDQAAAEADFKKAIALNGSYPDPFFFYADWLYGEGRISEALSFAKKAAEISPAFKRAHYLIMDIDAQTGDWKDLSSVAEAFLKTDPGNPIALAYLASERDPEALIQAGVEVLIPSHLPPTADDFITLSVFYYNAGLYGSSLLAAEAAADLDPRSPEAWNNIGAAYNKLEEWNKAIPALEKAIALRPDFELAKNNLAIARGSLH